jgi:hypothetical protein
MIFTKGPPFTLEWDLSLDITSRYFEARIYIQACAYSSMYNRVKAMIEMLNVDNECSTATVEAKRSSC